jgi:hypothetical protein
MMARPGGKRDWTPLDSIESADGARCVDIFVRADGSFGFEDFRRDAEDGGVWFITGHYAALRFATRAAAEVRARGTVAWLRAG